MPDSPIYDPFKQYEGSQPFSKINQPLYQFDPSKTDFGMVKNSGDIENLGFSPFWDNQATYANQASVFGDLFRGGKQLFYLGKDAFVNNFEQYGRDINFLASGKYDDLWERQNAEQIAARQQEIMEKYPIFTPFENRESALRYLPFFRGAGAFYARLMGQLGFTVGTIGATAVENMALAALTEGAGNVLASSKTAHNIYRGLYALVKTVKNADSLYDSIRVARGLDKGIDITTNVFKKGVNYLQMYHTAASEATFEAAGNYAFHKQSLIEDYTREHGFAPTGDALREIENNAIMMGNQSFRDNVGILMVSNAIQFGNWIKPFKPTSAELISAERLAGRIGIKDGKLLDIKDLSVFSKEYWKQTGVGGVLRPLGANFTEGFEEASQGIISKYTHDLYKRKYNKESYDTIDSIRSAFAEQFGTIHGWDDFMSGFIIGGVSHAASQTFEKFSPTNRESRDQQKKKVNELVGKFNATSSQSLFHEDANNARAQTTGKRSMQEAMDRDDIFSFKNFQEESFRDFVFSGIRSGKLGVRIDQLNDLKKLEGDAFQELFGTESKKTAHEYIDALVNKALEMRQAYDDLSSKYRNPYNPTKYKSGTREHLLELARFNAYETSKEKVLRFADIAQDSRKRIESIYRDIADYKSTFSTGVDVHDLLDDSLRLQRIKNLEDELSVIERTKGGREDAREKKEELDILRKFDVYVNNGDYLASNKSKDQLTNRLQQFQRDRKGRELFNRYNFLKKGFDSKLLLPEMEEQWKKAQDILKLQDQEKAYLLSHYHMLRPKSFSDDVIFNLRVFQQTMDDMAAPPPVQETTQIPEVVDTQLKPVQEAQPVQTGTQQTPPQKEGLKENAPGANAYSYKSEKYEITVSPANPIVGRNKPEVVVSVKDTSSSTGYRVSKALSQEFDTIEEAKEYAQELIDKDSSTPPPPPAEQQPQGEEKPEKNFYNLEKGDKIGIRAGKNVSIAEITSVRDLPKGNKLYAVSYSVMGTPLTDNLLASDLNDTDYFIVTEETPPVTVPQAVQGEATEQEVRDELEDKGIEVEPVVNEIKEIKEELQAGPEEELANLIRGAGSLEDLNNRIAQLPDWFVEKYQKWLTTLVKKFKNLERLLQISSYKLVKVLGKKYYYKLNEDGSFVLFNKNGNKLSPRSKAYQEIVKKLAKNGTLYEGLDQDQIGTIWSALHDLPATNGASSTDYKVQEQLENLGAVRLNSKAKSELKYLTGSSRIVSKFISKDAKNVPEDLVNDDISLSDIMEFLARFPNGISDTDYDAMRTDNAQSVIYSVLGLSVNEENVMNIMATIPTPEDFDNPPDVDEEEIEDKLQALFPGKSYLLEDGTIDFKTLLKDLQENQAAIEYLLDEGIYEEFVKLLSDGIKKQEEDSQSDQDSEDFKEAKEKALSQESFLDAVDVIRHAPLDQSQKNTIFSLVVDKFSELEPDTINLFLINNTEFGYAGISATPDQIVQIFGDGRNDYIIVNEDAGTYTLQNLDDASDTKTVAKDSVYFLNKEPIEGKDYFKNIDDPISASEISAFTLGGLSTWRRDVSSNPNGKNLVIVASRNFSMGNQKRQSRYNMTRKEVFPSKKQMSKLAKGEPIVAVSRVYDIDITVHEKMPDGSLSREFFDYIGLTSWTLVTPEGTFPLFENETIEKFGDKFWKIVADQIKVGGKPITKGQFLQMQGIYFKQRDFRQNMLNRLGNEESIEVNPKDVGVYFRKGAGILDYQEDSDQYNPVEAVNKFNNKDGKVNGHLLIFNGTTFMNDGVLVDGERSFRRYLKEEYFINLDEVQSEIEFIKTQTQLDKFVIYIYGAGSRNSGYHIVAIKPKLFVEDMVKDLLEYAKSASTTDEGIAKFNADNDQNNKSRRVYIRTYDHKNITFTPHLFKNKDGSVVFSIIIKDEPNDKKAYVRIPVADLPDSSLRVRDYYEKLKVQISDELVRLGVPRSYLIVSKGGREILQFAANDLRPTPEQFSDPNFYRQYLSAFYPVVNRGIVSSGSFYISIGGGQPVAQEPTPIVTEKVPESTEPIKSTDSLLDKMRKIRGGEDEIPQFSFTRRDGIVDAEEIDYVRFIAPQFDIDNIDTIIDNLHTKNIPMGVFRDNVIYLGEHSSKGTAYHEAFHGVFSALLTDAERDKYLHYVGSRNKVTENELAIYAASRGYSNLPYEKVLDLYLEDIMADKFADWKINRTKKGNTFLEPLFKLIQKIIDFFKRISNPMDTLFQQIDRGYFRSRRIDNVDSVDRFELLPVRENKGRTEYLPQNIGKQIINTITYRTLISESDLPLNSRVELALMSYQQEYTEDAIQARISQVSQGSRVKYEAEVLPKEVAIHDALNNEVTKNLIREQVKRNISAVQELSEDEDIEETSENYEKSAWEYSPLDSISRELRRLISYQTISYKDKFGIQRERTLDGNVIFNSLLRLLSNTNEALILPKIEDYGRYNEDVAALFEKMRDEWFGLVKENGEWTPKKNMSLWRKFVSSMNNTILDHSIVRIRTTGDQVRGYKSRAEIINESLFALRREKVSQWETSYNDIILERGANHVKNRLNIVRTIFASQEPVTEQSLANDTRTVQAALEDIGIELSKIYVEVSILNQKAGIGISPNAVNENDLLSIPMSFRDGTGGRKMRPEFAGKSTYELIKEGKRTGTSRDRSKPYNNYPLKEGQIIKFTSTEYPGEYIVAQVTKVPYPVNSITAEQWSKLEGWDASMWKGLVDKGYEQFQFKYLYTSTGGKQQKTNKLTPVLTNRLSLYKGSLAYFMSLEDIDEIIKVVSKDGNPFEMSSEGKGGREIRLGNRTRLNRIAEANSIVDPATPVIPFKNAEDKNVWNVVRNTSLTNRFRQLKKDRLALVGNRDSLDIETDEFLADNPMNDPRYDDYFQSLSIGILSGIRQDIVSTKTESREGQTFKHFDMRSYLLADIGLYTNQNASKVEGMTVSQGVLMQLEATSTAYVIDMPVEQFFANRRITPLGQRMLLHSVKQEYERIRREWKRFNDEGPGDVLNYNDTEKGRAFKFMTVAPYFNKTDLGLIDMAKQDIPFEEIPNLKELNKLIFDYHNNEVDWLISTLKSYGILGTSIIPDKVPREPEALDNWLFNYHLNRHIQTHFINQYLRGDASKSYKSTVDIVKRQKQFAGFNNNLQSGVHSVKVVPDGFHYINKNDVTDVITDIEWNDLNDSDKSRYSKKEATDGQSVNTIYHRLFIETQTGKIDNQIKEVYRDIVKGKRLSSAQVRLLEGKGVTLRSIKTLTSGGVKNVYIKKSEHTLTRYAYSLLRDGADRDALDELYDQLLDMVETPSLFTKEKWQDLVATIQSYWEPMPGFEYWHEVMNDMEFNLIDEIAHKSASKGYTVLNKTLYVNNIHKGIQTETPSGKRTITEPTQLIELLQMEQNDSELVDIAWLGKNIRVGEVRAMYRTELGKIRDAQHKLAMSFFKENPDGTIDSTQFYRDAAAQFENQGADENTIRFFANDFNINLPNIRIDAERLFLSHFSRFVFSQKVPGLQLYLVTDYGHHVVVDENDNVITKDEIRRRPKTFRNYKTRNLKMKTDEEGRLYAEIILPHQFEFKGIKPGEMLENETIKEIYTLLGVRIPTGNKNYIQYMKVVDFLPAEYGSIIIVPTSVHELSGSDLDIDKVYAQRKEFFIDKNGNPQIFDDASSYEQYLAHMKGTRIVKEQMAIIGGEKFASEEELFSELFNLDSKEDKILGAALTRLKYPSTKEEFEKWYPKNKDYNTTVKNNQILDLKIALQTNESVRDFALTKESTDEYDSYILQAYGVKSLDEAYQTILGTHMVDSIEGRFVSNKLASQGKNGISIYAVANKINSLMSTVRYNIPPIWSVVVDNEFYVFDSYSEDPKKVKVFGRPAQALAASLSINVDNPKDPKPALLNLDEVVAGPHAQMLSVGMGIPLTLTIIRHPAVQSFVEYAKSQNFAVLDPNERTYLSRKQKVNEYLKKTYPNLFDDYGKIKDNTFEQYVNEPLVFSPDAQQIEGGTELGPKLVYLFIKQMEYTEKVSKVNDALALTKALPSSIEDVVTKFARLDSIELITSFNTDGQKGEFASVLTDPLVKTNLGNFIKMYELTTKMFISESPAFRQVVNSIFASLKNRPEYKEQIKRELLGYMLVKAYQKYLSDVIAQFNNDTTRKILTSFSTYNYLQFDSHLAEDFKMLAEKYPDNAFLRFLRVESIKGLSLINTAYRANFSPDKTNDMIDSYNELLTSPDLSARVFAEQLYLGSLVRDNLYYTGKSYIKYIPAEKFRKASDLIGQIQLGLISGNIGTVVNVDDFVKDFFEIYGRNIKNLDKLKQFGTVAKLQDHKDVPIVKNNMETIIDANKNKAWKDIVVGSTVEFSIYDKKSAKLAGLKVEDEVIIFPLVMKNGLGDIYILNKVDDAPPVLFDPDKFSPTRTYSITGRSGTYVRYSPNGHTNLNPYAFSDANNAFLYNLMKSFEEDKYQTLNSRKEMIEEIKSGKWDQEFAAKMISRKAFAQNVANANTFQINRMRELLKSDTLEYLAKEVSKHIFMHTTAADVAEALPKVDRKLPAKERFINLATIIFEKKC